VLTEHSEERDGAWSGLTGFINEDIIRESDLPEPSDETFIGVCGPPDMQNAVYKHL
jgi:NAD(P)H-flavin reductase